MSLLWCEQRTQKQTTADESKRGFNEGKRGKQKALTRWKKTYVNTVQKVQIKTLIKKKNTVQSHNERKTTYEKEKKHSK